MSSTGLMRRPQEGYTRRVGGLGLAPGRRWNDQGGNRSPGKLHRERPSAGWARTRRGERGAFVDAPDPAPPSVRRRFPSSPLTDVLEDEDALDGIEGVITEWDTERARRFRTATAWVPWTTLSSALVELPPAVQSAVADYLAARVRLT